MGFFSKLRNFITGKGWKEDEEVIESIQPPPVPEESSELERSEESQYQRMGEEKPPESKFPKKDKQKRPTDEAEREKGEEEVSLKSRAKKGAEIKRAVRQYERVPKVSTIEKGISNEGENRLNIPQTQIGDMNSLRPQYNKILTENAKLNDPDILEVLFRGRAQLQHRFAAEITVYIDNKKANTLEVMGVLIEHTGMTYNYVNLGMQIDSPPQLDNLLVELGKTFESNFGAINSELKSRNSYKGKVTDINIDVTFA